MTTLVTGASGFLGRAVLRQLAASARNDRVLAADLSTPQIPRDRRFTAAAADITDAASRRELIAEADRIIHLAAVPGGTSEADYAASRGVNLEASLALLEETAALRPRTRFVYASTIAVFSAPLPPQIDDATPPRPTMTYGAHKLMVEIALANLTRLGRLDGLALRLPGLVARPAGENGPQSAFISDIFRAAQAHEPFLVPMKAVATLWLMSARQAADNLLRAAFMRTPTEATPRVMTLPALRVRASDLVGEIVVETGSRSSFRYEPDAVLEAQFGELPPLSTPLAEALGFAHDGDLSRLVCTVIEDLAEEEPRLGRGAPQASQAVA